DRARWSEAEELQREDATYDGVAPWAVVLRPRAPFHPKPPGSIKSLLGASASRYDDGLAMRHGQIKQRLASGGSIEAAGRRSVLDLHVAGVPTAAEDPVRPCAGEVPALAPPGSRFASAEVERRFDSAARPDRA